MDKVIPLSLSNCFHSFFSPFTLSCLLSFSPSCLTLPSCFLPVGQTKKEGTENIIFNNLKIQFLGSSLKVCCCCFCWIGDSSRTRVKVAFFPSAYPYSFPLSTFSPQLFSTFWGNEGGEDDHDVNRVSHEKVCNGGYLTSSHLSHLVSSSSFFLPTRKFSNLFRG